MPLCMVVKELGDMLDNDVVGSSFSIFFLFMAIAKQGGFRPKACPKRIVGFNLGLAQKSFRPTNILGRVLGPIKRFSAQRKPFKSFRPDGPIRIFGPLMLNKRFLAQ